MRVLAKLALGVSLFATAPAFAQQVVTLKSQVTDADGRVTLGDVFDNAGVASDVVVASRSGATVVLDAGRVQAAAAQAGVVWSNPTGLRRIIVSAGADGLGASLVASPGAYAQPAPAVTAKIVPVGGMNRQVLVFTRAMNTGEIVQPEDLMFAPAAAVSGNLPSDARAIIGKSVRYPMAQGAVLHTSDVSSPMVVKRNEAVSVTWAANGMSLNMTGTAQKDAAVGDVIQVQNPASKKMIDAVITGPGQALAGPAATQLRSATLLSSR